MPVPLYPPEIDTLNILPEHTLLRLLAAAGAELSPAEVKARLGEGRDQVPAGLLQALDRITAMADAPGYADLGEAYGPMFAADLGPHELAASAWLERRDLFDRVYHRRAFGRRGHFHEYAGREPCRLARPDARQVRNLERALGTRFENRGGTSHCRVHTFAYDDAIGFEVAHGRPQTSRRVVEVDGAGRTYPDRLSFRPHQTDVVIYDNRTHRIRVCAPNAFTLRTYLQVFSAELFGAIGWFVDGDVVSLSPLVQHGTDSLLATGGVRKVELVSLELRFAGTLETKCIVQSPDVFGSLRQIELGNETGVPYRARLRFTYTGGGRPRTMTLGVPNQLVYDRTRDEEVTRSFLEQRGFLASAPAGMRATG